MKKPTKPYRPAEPKKILSGEHTWAYINMDDTLQSILDVIGNVDPARVVFDYDCDPHANCFRFEWETPEKPNPNYEKQLKEYHKKLVDYPAKLAEYEKSLAEWKNYKKSEQQQQDLREYERLKRKFAR